MAVAAVTGFQIGMVAVMSAFTGLLAGIPAAVALAVGGGCALTGTLAYVVCQKTVSGHSARRLLLGHVAGETAKVAVALGLLAWALSADTAYAGFYLAGFIVALLAFPVAVLALKK